MSRCLPAPGSIWAEDTSIEHDSCPPQSSGDHAQHEDALLLRLSEVELLHAFNQPGEGLLCCQKVLSSLIGRQLRSPVSHLRSFHGFQRLQLGCLPNSELRFRQLH